MVMSSEESYSSSVLGTGQELHSGEQKVLGVRWNVSSDQIVLNLDEVASILLTLEPTKRNIVSLVGKIFDPLGFLSPVVIRFKIFFQELCEAKLEWDQPLSGQLLRKWITLGSSLQDSISISIPRCYYDGISNPVISCTICGFCDASLKAYCRVKNGNSVTTLRLTCFDD